MWRMESSAMFLLVDSSNAVRITGIAARVSLTVRTEFETEVLKSKKKCKKTA